MPGTTVPNGTKVPGTPYQMDPVSVSSLASACGHAHDKLLTSDLFTVVAPLLSAPRSAGSTSTSELSGSRKVSFPREKVRKRKLTPSLLQLFVFLSEHIQSALSP